MTSLASLRVSRPASASAFLAIGCAGLFACPLPAVANDDVSADAASDAEGSILLTGQRDHDDVNVKQTAPLLNTPRSIVVVDKQVIKETGAATLVEALRTVPGITFGAAEGGNPIGDRPFIRGFDSQGSTFVDGVRDSGAQSREVFAVEQIQVVRGSDSTLSGRGSAGGSLNIISKLPQREDFVAASLSGGTADYKRATIDVNHKLGDIVGVRLAAMWHDQNVAGRDAIWQDRWGFAPSLTIGLGEPTKLTFAYYEMHSHELPDSGIPYLYTLANAPATGQVTYSQPAIGNVTTISGQTGYVDRSTFYGLAARDYRDTTTRQATVRADHDFGNGIKLRNTTRYGYNSQEYSFLLPDDSTGNVFGTSATNPGDAAGSITSGGYVWRRANTRFGTTENWTTQSDLYGELKTGALTHNFAVGAELSAEQAERGALVMATGNTVSPRCNTLTIARFYCTSLFNPNPYDPWVNYASDAAGAAVTPVTRGAPETRTINKAWTKAAYGFDSISIGNSLIVNLGARFDNFTTRVYLPVIAGMRPSVRREDNIFNWQAGLVYKPSADISLYGSYATSATPPNSLIGEGQEQNSLGTLPSTTTPAQLAAAIAALQANAADALKVERSKSYELGAKALLFSEQLSLNLALFQTETENLRVTSDANTVAFIGKRRIKGVELSFNGNITPRWSLTGGYTYLDAVIVDGGYTALTAPAVTGQAAKTVLVPSVNTGQRAPQTADHSFTIWTNYAFPFGLSIGGGALYNSRVFGGYQDNRSAVQNSAGVVSVVPATRLVDRTVPGYWRFDARIGYKISEAIDLSVNINNLTDKVYFNQAYTSHYASIAPGRSAIATLNVRY